MNPEPDCPAGRHYSARAHQAGCTCGSTTGGESWRRWQAQRAAERERLARRWREKGRTGVTFRRFADPKAYVGTDRRRELESRTDLACRNEDSEIFDIDQGPETSYINRVRIVRARGICGQCPALTLCAEVALADGDDTWTFRGGMSPEERHRLRQKGTHARPAGVRADDDDGVRDAGGADGVRPADEPVDENIVAAFIQERPPRWADLNTAERALLTRELRRRKYTINSVALATHTSHTAVANFWKQAA